MADQFNLFGAADALPPARAPKAATSAFLPTIETRPHPVRRYSVHWATVTDQSGKHVWQTGPFDSIKSARKEAWAKAGKMNRENPSALSAGQPAGIRAT